MCPTYSCFIPKQEEGTETAKALGGSAAVLIGLVLMFLYARKHYHIDWPYKRINVQRSESHQHIYNKTVKEEEVLFELQGLEIESPLLHEV